VWRFHAVFWSLFWSLMTCVPLWATNHLATKFSGMVNAVSLGDHMKKILLTALLLVPASSFAQTSPPGGCFIEPGGFPFCSSGDILCGDGGFNNEAYFGHSVGELCDRYNYMRELKAGVQAQLDQCTAANTQSNNVLQEWVAYGKYQAKLAKRLKKACGAACKKIK
jgi:hypothetical protein